MYSIKHTFTYVYLFVFCSQLDMYSLGVTMWVLLYGVYVPEDRNPLDMTDNCSGVPDMLREPLLGLLCALPDHRWSAEQCVSWASTTNCIMRLRLADLFH